MAFSNPVAPDVRTHLQILATTDLHVNLTGYNYYADRADVSVGLTRTASLIRTARAEAAQRGALSLLFDNGDAFQGTPMGDLATEAPDKPHPLMRAFDYLGYDAIGLGNHDFNFGLDALGAVLAQALCPVVCSNLRRLDPRLLSQILPYAVLERTVPLGDQQMPLRIGVLSFLPPQTVIWDAHLLAGRIEVDDIVSAARHWLPQLQHQGCDVVVALAHSGLSCGPAHSGMENAVLPLAALDGIHAIIAGHTHLHLPSPNHAGLDADSAETGAVCGTPVVMPGASGSHLGQIDLDIRTGPDGRWGVTGFDCRLRAISGRSATGEITPNVPEDSGLRDLLAHDHAATRARMDQPIGRASQAMHSYFSFIAADRSLAIVAAAQAAALRPALVDTSGDGLPLLSAVAPGKYGGRSGPLSYTDVPAGRIALRHVADLYVFPNELRAVIISGQQVLDWLEMSASLFHQIAPDSHDQDLVNAQFPGHNFDVLHGLTWQIDLSVPPRFYPDGTRRPGDHRRICAPCHNGKPVRGDQQFVVALNSYRASGGGGFAALKGACHLSIAPKKNRDILQDYLAGRLACDPLASAPPPWGFVAMPGTSVSVSTGPGAMEHLGDLTGRGVRVGDRDGDGFLRLILPL
ncbi:MAG: 2',3'-cyclic-nucleotide 2'-phosphodiesterase/3'-nucleotidase [Paracoccaceae bacterium]|jgi:2',3'-cyclic-nucleotide 2'-phosphodiesterase/3'-nucleotidase